MKKNTILFTSLCTILLYCCGSNVDSPKIVEELKSATSSSFKEDVTADPKMRSQALGILAHRMKNEPESYAIIEAGVLNYEYVYDGRKMSKKGEYAGDWIDFKNDFTYEYGRYDEIIGSGKYHYSLDKGEMVMVDNDASKNPQEWTIKAGGDMIVKVGTQTYGNNAFQIKLNRIPQKPVKQQ